MTRQLIVILLAVIFIASCSEKDRVPKGILPQSKMESVLWDMISADEFVSGYSLLQNPSLDRKQESFKLYDEIFSIHKITAKEFRNSLSFYQSHPSLLVSILDSITAKHNVVPARSERPLLKDSLNLKIKAIE